ncbi:MAG: PAS domain-containing protein [Candidatus Izemoplasma sp.]|nr:PAS domain-containing protein [Candidatus Izemoplasma sp.]
MEVFQYDEDKIKRLNEFMKAFEEADSGKARRQIYMTYEDTIDSVQALDLFYTHFYGETSNKSVDNILESADLFVNMFSTPLERHKPDYNHVYFKLFTDENKAITTRFDQAKAIIKRNDLKKDKDDLKEALGKPYEINKMFVKRENILFPHLEEVAPSDKPLQVLWQLHNEAKASLKELINQLNSDDFDDKNMRYLIGEFYFLLYGIITKEELILLPAAHHLLDRKTLNQMTKELFNYGFAYIHPNMPDLSNDDTDKHVADSLDEAPKNLESPFFSSETGSLSIEQVRLIFGTIPLDITYVDEHDQVVYYNDRPSRHFPRNPSIIGRLVENCHPPKSVHVVKQIVTDFKSGKRDMAEFYINFQGVFLYITYYAVRDKENTYKGVLEVSQDVTHIRELEGEKRLLDE